MSGSVAGLYALALLDSWWLWAVTVVCLAALGFSARRRRALRLPGVAWLTGVGSAVALATAIEAWGETSGSRLEPRRQTEAITVCESLAGVRRRPRGGGGERPVEVDVRKAPRGEGGGGENVTQDLDLVERVLVVEHGRSVLEPRPFFMLRRRRWRALRTLSSALDEVADQEAERDGDQEVAELFRKAQTQSRKGAEQGKALLRSRLQG